MEEIIDELLNAKTKEKMRNVFEKLTKLIENMEKEEKEIFFDLLIAKLKCKQIELEKQNRFLDSNIFIYEKDISIQAAIIEELIVDDENNEDLEEIIKYLKNKYLNKKIKKSNAKEIEPDTVKKLIAILQKEYKLVDIINASETKVSILFLNEEVRNDMEVVNYNVIKNNKFALHIYKMKGDNEVSAILEQFGLILNEMLVGDSQRVPDSFIEFCRQRNVELDEESKKCISVFTQLFALASVMKLKGTEEKGELEVIEYYDNLIGDLYHKVCEQNGKVEWNDNEKCPCGSGKKYAKCCKKKDIKYYQTEDKEHYTKSLNIPKELDKIFYQRRKDFRKWFGRDIKKEEYIMPELINQDFREVDRVLKREFPEEIDKVYAHSKTGILLTEHNINQYSNADIKEFKDAVKEYRRLMQQKIVNNKANEIQVVEFVNYKMQSLCDSELEPIHFCFRLIMKELSPKVKENVSLIVENKNDFFAYCIYKMNRNLTAINHLTEEGHFEIVMATVRFIYEILLNIVVYMNDDQLFKEKILTIAGLEKGLYTKKSKNIVIDNKTKEEFNTKMRVSDLVEQSEENYKKLYSALYPETSSFIHVDVLAAHKIFNDNDLFLDLDESYVATTIAITLGIITISIFSKSELISKKLQKDLMYYTNIAAKKLDKILQAIKIVDNKEIYDVLIDCLELDKRDYKINYERMKKTEII